MTRSIRPKIPPPREFPARSEALPIDSVRGRYGNPPGVERHAMLAAEVGATWEEIAGAILLTQPSFGLVPALEAFPHARRGWHTGQEQPTETE